MTPLRGHGQINFEKVFLDALQQMEIGKLRRTAIP